MIIRFAVIGAAIALAVTAAGAHQSSKSGEEKLGRIAAEQQPQGYRLPAQEIWTVLPDHRTRGRDAGNVELAHEGMGHCQSCHL